MIYESKKHVNRSIPQVSLHNAGHAVATALIEHAHATEAACVNVDHAKRWNAEYEVMTALGGVIAERLFLGDVEPNGAKNDIENAFRHVSALTSIPGEQAAYVAFLNSRVEYLLGNHSDFIEHVATTLERTGRPANDIAREVVDEFAK
jgi:hypothetical protein